MRTASFCIILFFFVLSCGKDDVNRPINESEPTTAVPKEDENMPNPLLQLDGVRIVDAKKNPVYIN